MEIALTIWLALTLILGSLATLAVWARGYSRARAISVVAFLLGTPITAAATIACLGRPTPVMPVLSPMPTTVVTLLGMKLEPGTAIYVLVDADAGAPRLYRLPWDPNRAMTLQQAQEEAQRTNRRLRGRFGVMSEEGALSGGESSDGGFDPEVPTTAPEVKIVPPAAPVLSIPPY